MSALGDHLRELLQLSLSSSSINSSSSTTAIISIEVITDTARIPANDLINVNRTNQGLEKLQPLRFTPSDSSNESSTKKKSRWANMVLNDECSSCTATTATTVSNSISSFSTSGSQSSVGSVGGDPVDVSMPNNISCMGMIIPSRSESPIKVKKPSVRRRLLSGSMIPPKQPPAHPKLPIPLVESLPDLYNVTKLVPISLSFNQLREEKFTVDLERAHRMVVLSELNKPKASICFVVKRPGCVLCHEQGQALKELIKEFPHQSVAAWAVIKETGVDDEGLLSLYQKHFPFQFFRDTDLAMYNALGDRRVRMITVARRYRSSKKRYRRKGFDGSIVGKGEGLILGGVVILDKRGIIKYAHQERFGLELPVEEIKRELQQIVSAEAEESSSSYFMALDQRKSQNGETLNPELDFIKTMKPTKRVRFDLGEKEQTEPSPRGKPGGTARQVNPKLDFGITSKPTKRVRFNLSQRSNRNISREPGGTTHQMNPALKPTKRVRFNLGERTNLTNTSRERGVTAHQTTKYGRVL